MAAYELSEALGWGLVPRTVLRAEGPLGEGSLQEFVHADFEQHYFTLYEDEQYHDQLRAICAFDLLANNTDRKSGHCLLGRDGRIYAIDNGLSFHHEFKLRTVIWEFGGEPVPAPLLEDVTRLADDGPQPAADGPARSVRARRAADPGPRPGPRRLLPGRPHRPPLPLAPRLTAGICPDPGGPAGSGATGPRMRSR